MATIDGLIAAAPAVAWLCASWLAVFLLLTGVGATLRHAYARALAGRQGGAPAGTLAWLDFWVGFAGTALMLQLWNFWLPVDGRALSVLALFAAPGLAPRLREQLPGMPRSLPWAGVLLSIAAPWLALRGLGALRDGDTGLYHLQSVSWAMSFPIIPGLGNLHDRLAFNSAFHLYAALCEAMPGGPPAWRIASAPFLLVALVQLIHFAAEDRGAAWQRAFSLLMIGPVAAQSLTPQFFGLAPDFAVFAMQITITNLLLWRQGRRDSEGSRGYGLVATVVLCAASISLKLSAAVFAVVAVAVCVHQARPFSRRGDSAVALLVGGGAGVVLLGVWAARNVVLSGYPFYPLPILALPVDWRLPRPLVLDMSYWIRSWARLPAAHWVDVLGDHTWMQPWLRARLGELVAPAFCTTAGLLLGALALLRSNPLPWRSLGVAAPAVIAAAAWFVTAPDVRFGRGPIWISAVGIFAVGLTSALARTRRGPRSAVEVSVGLALAAYLLNGAWRLPPKAGEPLPAPEIHHYPAADGTRIYHPQPRHLCWDAPLPCTPYRRASLALRRSGELASGFRLRRPYECINIHSCRPPHGLRAPEDVGVDLVRGDWHAWKADRNHRWMNSIGRLVLYVDSPRSIALRVHVAAVDRRDGGEPVEVLLGEHRLATWFVEPGGIFAARADLRRGFNVVSMQVAGSKRARPLWNPADGRPSLAVSMIEIVDRQRQ